MEWPVAYMRLPVCNHGWGCGGREEILTHWGWDKMAATLADDTFKCKFVNENILI